VEFFGFVITLDSIEIGEEKLDMIKEWQALRSLRDIQSSLGFANFYRHFIKNCLKISRPLTVSSKGERKDYCWTSAMEDSFEPLNK
jgi:hypothetical protein